MIRNRPYIKYWHRTKKQVLERDNYKCTLCGETKERLEVDHIVPIVHKGSNRISNLRILCRICHKLKSKKERGDRETPISKIEVYMKLFDIGLENRKYQTSRCPKCLCFKSECYNFKPGEMYFNDCRPKNDRFTFYIEGGCYHNCCDKNRWNYRDLLFMFELPPTEAVFEIKYPGELDIIIDKINTRYLMKRML